MPENQTGNADYDAGLTVEHIGGCNPGCDETGHLLTADRDAGIGAILGGLRKVRQDIADDEAVARADGLEGIARAYAVAGARVEGAIRGIELSYILPPAGTDA